MVMLTDLKNTAMGSEERCSKFRQRFWGKPQLHLLLIFGFDVQGSALIKPTPN